MAMIATLWARRVADGDHKIEDVPPGLRADVKSALNMIRAAEQLGDDKKSVGVSAIDQLADALKQRTSAGEDIRQIIRSLDLSDADKWELERRVKEG